jgi:phosphoglucosamine mutase
MISASHNPVQDNGIKFFGSDGFKLSDETENQIEQLMDAEVDELPRPIGKDMGIVTVDEGAKYRYSEFLQSTVTERFNGLKIVLDCAHGAAYELAPLVFRELGAEVITIGAEPTGLNINEKCGSTHTEMIREAVVAHKADIGLSFDGDADRLIAIDHTGAEVDGDFILCICGEGMKQQGKLNNDTIVTTVMSNIGFFKAIEKVGIQAKTTGVGDRYVMEEMRKGGYNLGGEQSGHVIFLDYNTTGDGILSGIQLVATLVRNKKSLAEVRMMMKQYPQVLVNVKGVDKQGLTSNEAVNAIIQDVETRLGDEGRVLVRPSGTEPLIRVMAEGPEFEMVRTYVNEIADVIKRELTL